MFKSFGCLRPWEETDDILQNSMMRLWSALEELTPRSPREYFGLAALQIRRELLDLVRHYYGPQGPAVGQGPAPPAADSADSTPQPAGDRGDTTYEPSRLAVWTEFHAWVAGLPADERELFDLLVYQDLPQAVVGEMLGLSERTLRRRWVELRQRMHQVLKGRWPGL
jgi:RNA polymerase sigma-70 factor (ECF subfamily)